LPICTKRITIDTSTTQPCIYACMREGFKVEIEWLVQEHGAPADPIKRVYELGKEKFKFMQFWHEVSCMLKSIKILGTEDMDGVEVRT
jgi:hypothetical protein